MRKKKTDGLVHLFVLFFLDLLSAWASQLADILETPVNTGRDERGWFHPARPVHPWLKDQYIHYWFHYRSDWTFRLTISSISSLDTGRFERANNTVKNLIPKIAQRVPSFLTTTRVLSPTLVGREVLTFLHSQRQRIMLSSACLLSTTLDLFYISDNAYHSSQNPNTSL